MLKYTYLTDFHKLKPFQMHTDEEADETRSSPVKVAHSNSFTTITATVTLSLTLALTLSIALTTSLTLTSLNPNLNSNLCHYQDVWGTSLSGS